MKRIVDIFTRDWSPEVVWTYIINLEGNTNSMQLNQNEVDASAFELEALRLAIEDGCGYKENLIAKVRE
ncbi:hypothetical protein [Polynucleobacter sp. MWH-UH23A]|uniref:hypothetical protein n=1 Tax=Polynucleobacter sp. MWH-UH23A TaxID=1855613 RepID=UPI003364D019